MAQTSNAAKPLSSICLIPLWLAALERRGSLTTREGEKDESDPPQTGGDLRPKVESRYGVPLLGPMGSLSSSFIPAGRLGKTPLSPRASSFQIGPWTAPGRSEGMTVYEGKGGV